MSLKDLSKELRNQSTSSNVNRQTVLLPLLRTALNDLTLSPVRGGLSSDDLSAQARLVGELFGLLVSDVSVQNSAVLTLLTGLIRELSVNGQVPRFVNERLSCYSVDRLRFLLPLLRNLRMSAPMISGFNLDFLSQIAVNTQLAIPVRLEALTTLIHMGRGSHALTRSDAMGRVDACIAEVLKTSSAVDTAALAGRKRGLLKRVVASLTTEGVSPAGMELDGSIVAANEPFTALVHLSLFSPDQLMHIGVFSSLSNYLSLRFVPVGGHPPEAPPTTPAAGIAPTPLIPSFTDDTTGLTDAVVAMAVRILSQCQRDISALILNGKKKWKFVASPPSSQAKPGEPAGSPTSASLGIHSPLVGWTREFVESVIVEVVKCLDVICKRDPSVVSLVFPHVRKVYERVLQRPDSPGIAICQTVQFFINHSYLVIFDIEPVLRFFFATHIPKIVSPSTLVPRKCSLALESIIFLNDYCSVLASVHTSVFVRHFPSVLRLAAWFPRSAGGELEDVIANLVRVGATDTVLVDLFHTIMDIPLIAGISELSLNIDDYVETGHAGGGSTCPTVLELNPGREDQSTHICHSPDPTEEPDQFASARSFMRLIRSVEFKDVSDYANRVELPLDKPAGSNVWTNNVSGSRTISLLTDLWEGLPLTPRVSAASKLVPRYIDVFLRAVRQTECNQVTSEILRCILTRFGNSKIFLFRPEIASLFLQYISDVISPPLLAVHRNEVVTAVLERVLDGSVQGSDLVVHLVYLIGEMGSKSDSLGLFVRLLRWLLAGDTVANQLDPEVDIAYVKIGRVVRKPDHQHPILDSPARPARSDPHLTVIVVTALTKLASNFPQYRPQTEALFEAVRTRTDPGSVVTERIRESLIVLRSFHLSQQLLGSPNTYSIRE